MVQDELWLAVNTSKKGLLCFACLERKLGRQLVMDDFKLALVNLPVIKGYLMGKSALASSASPG